MNIALVFFASQLTWYTINDWLFYITIIICWINMIFPMGPCFITKLYVKKLINGCQRVEVAWKLIELFFRPISSVVLIGNTFQKLCNDCSGNINSLFDKATHPLYTNLIMDALGIGTRIQYQRRFLFPEIIFEFGKFYQLLD